MRKRVVLTGCAVLCVLGASELNAQARVGPQLSLGSKQDVGLGARLLVNIKSVEHLAFIGTFDLFFPDDGSYWELNGNVAYSFDITGAPSLSPYVGGGLNIAHKSHDHHHGHDHHHHDGESDTDLGINLLGGTQFGTGSVNPFVELRIELAGGEQFVITGGVLF